MCAPPMLCSLVCRGPHVLCVLVRLSPPVLFLGLPWSPLLCALVRLNLRMLCALVYLSLLVLCSLVRHGPRVLFLGPPYDGPRVLFLGLLWLPQASNQALRRQCTYVGNVQAEHTVGGPAAVVIGLVDSPTVRGHFILPPHGGSPCTVGRGRFPESIKPIPPHIRLIL